MLNLPETSKRIFLASLLSLSTSFSLACEDHKESSKSKYKTVEESLSEAASDIGDTFDKISRNLQQSAPEEMAKLEEAGKKIGDLLEQASESIKNETN